MSSLALSPNPTPNYHWSGPNQRRFLECLARDGVVSLAATAVSMSAQAAYDFRMRVEGRVFALGWLAAILVSRDRLFDDLMERAFLGQEEEVIRDPENNRLKRKRIDNRLGQGMLTRLDRMIADAAEREPLLPAARIVAGDFEKFLDLVEREGGGAEAGLFLAAVAGGKSDAFHYQLAQKSAASGEAIVPQENAPQVFDHSPEAHASDLSVWLDEDSAEWRTDFPPPVGFEGFEKGDYGSDGYQRVLSDAEASVQDTRLYIEDRPYLAAAHAARDAFFVPEPEVKAEMKARAAAERAEQKAEQKTQQAAAKLEEKRRRTEERLALAAQKCEQGEEPEPSQRVEDILETKADTDPGIILPSAPGNRIIAMPQKPRPLFGIYGDRLPTWDAR